MLLKLVIFRAKRGKEAHLHRESEGREPMKACQQCGSPVFNNAVVCPHCGSKDPRGVGPSSESADDASTVSGLQALLNDGLQLIAEGDFQAATNRLNQALVDAPEEQVARCYTLRGYAHLQSGNVEQAIADFDQAIQRDPLDAESFAWRGSAHGVQKNWRNSIEDYLQAIQLEEEGRHNFRGELNDYLDKAIPDLDQQLKAGSGSASLYRDRGFAHLQKGNHEKALLDFTKAVQQGDTESQTYYQRACCQSALGRPEEVVQDCTTAMKQGAEDANVYYLRASALRELEQYDRALEDLQKALNRSPQDPLVLRERALVRVAVGDLSGAVEDFQATLASLPEDTLSLASLADAFERLDQPGEAAECYSQLLHFGSDNAVQLRRGRCYIKAGYIEEAKSDFQEVIDRDPGSALAFCGQGQALAEIGEFEEAKAALNKALRLDQRCAAAFVARGDIYLATQQHEEATSDYSEALLLGGESIEAARVHFSRGVAYAELGKHAQAEKDFSQSLETNIADIDAIIKRASSRMRLKKWRLAIDDLVLAMELRPHGENQFRKLGEEDAHDAISQLSTALEDKPDQADLLRDRGIVQLFLGDHEEALADLNAAIALEQPDADMFLQRARIHSSMATWEACIEDCGRAIQIDAQRVEATALRGRAFQSMGRPQEALVDMTVAVQQDPGNARRWAARGQLLSRAGKHEKADADFSKAVNLSHALARYFILRGQARARAGHAQEAVGDFTAALTREPGCVDSLYGRGKSHAKLREFDRAIADFDQAIQLDPNRVELYCSRASAIAKQGDLPQAAIEYTKALANLPQDPRFILALERRARLFYRMGHLRQALADYRVTADQQEASNRRARAISAAGLCYMHLEKLEEAKAKFTEAIQEDDSDKIALLGLKWLSSTKSSLPPLLAMPTKKVDIPPPPIGSTPTDGTAEETWLGEPPLDLWIVCTPDGREHGPISMEGLNAWCSEGRLSDESQLLRGDWEQWRWASEVYPHLIVATARTTNRPVPVSLLPAVEEEPEEELDIKIQPWKGSPPPRPIEDDEEKMPQIRVE